MRKKVQNKHSIALYFFMKFVILKYMLHGIRERGMSICCEAALFREVMDIHGF